MPTETSRASIARRAASVLAGILVAVSIAWLVAEILLRLFLPQLTGPLQGEFSRDLGILPKPGAVTWRSVPPFYTYSARHDSAGRRVVAHQPASAASTALFLGDSFTYGSGVGDDGTFSSVTQGLLVERNANVRVLNAGNSGIGTDFELRYFQLRGKLEKPAVVDVFFFGNDFTDNAAGRFFDVLPDGSLLPKTLRESPFRLVVDMLPAHDFLLSHSHTVALLRTVPVLLQVRSILRARATNRQAPRYVDPSNQRLTSIYLTSLRGRSGNRARCSAYSISHPGRISNCFETRARSRRKKAP
jgi:hypothetical protein